LKTVNKAILVQPHNTQYSVEVKRRNRTFVELSFTVRFFITPANFHLFSDFTYALAKFGVAGSVAALFAVRRFSDVRAIRPNS
jgi:hypothetical protein